MCADPNLNAFLKAADELLARAGTHGVPTRLEIMAGLQGIHYVELTPSLGTHASLVPYAGGYMVLIDSHATPTRQRFSLAHEIAHTFVAPPHQALKGEASIRAELGAPLTREQEERICDQVAAQLLMPTHLFAAETQKLGCSLSSLSALAGRFAVSLEAALRRMAELAEVPLEATCWRVGGSPHAQAAAALAWHAGFGGFDRWFISNGKTRATSDPRFIRACSPTASRPVVVRDRLRVNGRWATVRSEARRYGSNGTSSIFTLTTVESWAGRHN